jgi:hypothetical protein
MIHCRTPHFLRGVLWVEAHLLPALTIEMRRYILVRILLDNLKIPIDLDSLLLRWTWTLLVLHFYKRILLEKTWRIDCDVVLLAKLDETTGPFIFLHREWRIIFKSDFGFFGRLIRYCLANHDFFDRLFGLRDNPQMTVLVDLGNAALKPGNEIVLLALLL